MQDLDRRVMEKFSKKKVATGKEATIVSILKFIIFIQQTIVLLLYYFTADGNSTTAFYLLFQISGINKILPSMKIDDFLFEPCGYSMNGILKNENIDFGLVSQFSEFIGSKYYL